MLNSIIFKNGKRLLQAIEVYCKKHKRKKIVREIIYHRNDPRRYYGFVDLYKGVAFEIREDYVNFTFKKGKFTDKPTRVLYCSPTRNKELKRYLKYLNKL